MQVNAWAAPRAAFGAVVLALGLWGGAGGAHAEQRVHAWADGAQVQVAQAGGGAGLATPFAVASVGKMFTAVAVLRLSERGALALDRPMAELMPDLWRDLRAPAGVTPRHLLAMTSGLPDYYTDDFIDAALADQAGVQNAGAALRAAFRDPPLFAPGDAFDYSNTNYVLLGVLLEHLTGQPLADVLRAEVFVPAAMADTFLAGSRPLPPDFAQGHPDRALLRGYYSGPGLGDGGCISTAGDLLRFMRALTDGTLLSTAMLAQMRADGSGAGYGLGLELDGAVIGHSGGDLGFASDLRMNLRTGRVAVALVAREDGPTDWAEEQVQDP